MSCTSMTAAAKNEPVARVPGQAHPEPGDGHAMTTGPAMVMRQIRKASVACIGRCSVYPGLLRPSWWL